ncbi:hypothetical protein B0T21DRAFT_380877 [Apiosordaria backusii]|uniref:NACHT domain-containing protein n=1 Tax=Apiosordaria backusii TaxID=314023 RepID=A0AA40K3M0_9PEZI|nr:hypothetical protein B0T21DRAFT_380877 [Apiosordaria backusii]
MRLLERSDTGEFRLTKHLPNDAIPEIPPYAILSHTWGDEEVLFKDLEDSTAKKKAGYAKIQFCGDQAKRDGLKYFWVDTCCIDKSDAAELQHALNSIFQWYRDAAKCYVYLTDVSSRKRNVDGNSSWELAFRKCRWFTRGWTLQELIAPAIVEFFSKDGERLGDKKSLEQEIHNITGIPPKALQGSPLSDFGVAERMKWIEKRNTKYEEDKAYSLFGIFDVHMPILYGEGEEKAFDRLQEKIDKNSHRLAKLWSTDPRDPRVEKKRIELAKGGLLVDAYHWVFNNPDFNRWHQLPDSRLLWIKGDPGKGKTMLLCGIIDELERPVIADGGNLAYFFCQATDSRINNPTAVLRGLIYLLAQRQPRLLSHLPENTYASDDAMAWIVLSKTLLEMLEDPNLKVTYLVIDALDWVVFSRNWVQIEEQLAIQYNSTIKNAVHHYLSFNADGTFLWVALVCQALANPNVRRWQTLNKLCALPPGLDSLYARMMKYIDNLDDANLCKQILGTATVVRRPVSLGELTALLEMPDDISDNPEYLEELIKLCGSFLSLREQTVYFAFNWVFPQGMEDVNHTIFSRSLNTMSTILQRDIYGLKAPGFLINKVQTLSLDPLATVRYSCVFWVDHLRDLISDEDTPQRNTLYAVQIFVEQKYLYWLEALSLIRAMSEGIIVIRQLEGLLGRTGQSHLTSFAYASALLFAPACSLVKKKFKTEEPGWISTKPVVEADWNTCLQTLEGYSDWVWSVAFSPDGQRLASGSDDETIKIWDANSGQCLQTLEGHGDSVSAVAFSADNPGWDRYSLGKDQSWILCNGRNVLWLPPEYRPYHFAVQRRMVAIGCRSGRTFTIGFSRNI